MPDTINEQTMIVSLLAYLDGQCRPGYRNLVTALVAERDALKQRVAELEAASQPADRDRRIDLACSIYPILLSAAWSRATATTTPEEMAQTHTALRDLAIVEADKMLAAMRKGEA